MTHQHLVKYIQDSVHEICPYSSGYKQQLYHAGFLASVIATLILFDSRNLTVFRTIINRKKAPLLK